MATTPLSISIQLPLPSSSTVNFGSVTIRSAWSYACCFDLHICARAKQARRVCPGYLSNSFSSMPTSDRQSAALPAKPHTVLSFIFLNFLAVFLNTVLPSDIWPSAMMATWSPFLTFKTVVEWKSGLYCENDLLKIRLIIYICG